MKRKTRELLSMAPTYIHAYTRRWRKNHCIVLRVTKRIQFSCRSSWSTKEKCRQKPYTDKCGDPYRITSACYALMATANTNNRHSRRLMCKPNVTRKFSPSTHVFEQSKSKRILALLTWR